MSNRVLSQALSDARLQTGHGIDILGFDACIYDDYKNYDPLTGTGNFSSFINLYAWDEFMAKYYIYAGLA